MILVENALRVATINTVGDFVLFLGKVKKRQGNGLCMLTFQNKNTRVRIYTHAGPNCDVHGVHWRVSAELSERLHRVGPAPHHRVSVRVPGGALLPVHLRGRGGRALPLFRH